MANFTKKGDMETIIKVTPAELNSTLINKIKTYIGDKQDIDITISLKEIDPDYTASLNQSISEAEKGEGILTFSMEDFMKYEPASKSSKWKM